MITFLKKCAFRLLGMETYLRLMQTGYFTAYHLGLLKRNETYKYHYFVKTLIKKGDTVIDIGANLGYYTFLFSEWTGDTGKVYAVEPVEIFNRVLRRKARNRKNIVFFPYALGTEEKETLMVTSSVSGYLRTGLPHIYDPVRDKQLREQDFSFKAEMKKPSELFKNIGKIDYVKCDVEGFEYTVLSDMKELLEKYRPIVQAEVWADNEQQLLDYFRLLGYTPCKLLQGKLVSDRELVRQAGGDYIFIYAAN